jgi:hypothetical protein
MNRILLLLFLSIFITKINAQDYFPNNESIQDKKSGREHIFTTVFFIKFTSPLPF